VTIASDFVETVRKLSALEQRTEDVMNSLARIDSRIQNLLDRLSRVEAKYENLQENVENKILAKVMSEVAIVKTMVRHYEEQLARASNEPRELPSKSNLLRQSNDVEEHP
jgi:predicted  nucleic acid-binding Zn-ribbon protein